LKGTGPNKQAAPHPWVWCGSIIKIISYDGIVVKPTSKMIINKRLNLKIIVKITFKNIFYLKINKNNIFLNLFLKSIHLKKIYKKFNYFLRTPHKYKQISLFSADNFIASIFPHTNNSGSFK
jgi:hypothetical protein